MSSLSSISVKRPVAMCCFIIMLVLLGLNAYRKIGIDLVPSIDVPYAQITTTYPGATPEEVEIEVARRIEDAVASLDGLKHTTSVCMENVCAMTLEFQIGVNIDLAVHDIREKINSIMEDFPAEVETPSISKINVNSFPVVTLYLTGDRKLDELYDYADDQLSDRFASIRGVAEVRLHGGNEMQLHILLDESRLSAAGLTVDDIVAKLKANNLKVPAGRIKGGRQELNVTYDAEFHDFESLKSLEIGKTPGVRLYLRDVAELELISKEIRQEGYFNRQAGVSIEIVKKGEANAVEVIREVRKRFEQIKGSRLLPGGMELLWFKDSGEFIISSVDDAWNSIITGILLTALLLFLFLHEPRSTFIIAVTMPVSVVVTFAAMQMMHYTFDMITLMSLGCSTGVLVTNSIVVIESIVNRLSAGAGRKNAAAEGTAEVITAVSASALTNVVVFVPVAMMTSMVGMLLAPFAGVMVIATLVSLFVSFTLTPILASIMLSDKPHKPNRIMAGLFRAWDAGYNRIAEGFNRSMVFTSKYPGTIASLIVAACLITAILVVPRVGVSFLPDNDRSEFTVKLEFPADYNIDTTRERTMRILDRIRAYPFVARTGTTIGYVNAMSGQVTEGVYLAEITVLLKPKDRRENLWAIMDRLRADFKDLENCRLTFNIPKPTGGSSTDISSYISGTDFAELEKANRHAISLLRKSGKVRDLDSSIRMGKPQINLKPIRPVLQNLKLDAATVGTSVGGFFEGLEVGTYKVGSRSFDIRVKMKEQRGLDQIDKFTVGFQDGKPMRLDTLLDKEFNSMSVSVIRQDKNRAAYIYGNLGQGAALSESLALMDEQVSPGLPAGYEIKHAGMAENMNDGAADFIEVFAIAIILTYLLIAAIMESWSRPFLIMFTVPLGFVGMYVAIWLAGLSLSMVGMLGAVMMIGIVVNNAILIMDECATLIRNGMTTHLAMLEAAKSKFRPVVMTSIASVAGMLPMAFGTGLGSELRASCGIGVVGGLTLSAVLTLYLIPALYFRFVRDTARTKQ